MNLKKRIYLLTPLLGLCCAVIASAYMGGNNTIGAENTGGTDFTLYPEDASLYVSANVQKTNDAPNLPNDINGDEIIDSEVMVSSGDGKIIYKKGEDVLSGTPLLVYEYNAQYRILKSSVGSYDGTYKLHKSDGTGSTISGLNLTELSKKEQEIDKVNYYTYDVKFSVPMGYTGAINLPEGSVVLCVNEISPANIDVVDEFAYHDTSLVVNVDHYVENTATSETGGTTLERDILTVENQLGYYFKAGQIDDYTYKNITIGTGIGNVRSVKYDFNNFYKSNLYDIQIEKKFQAGDPVPVGQSILFKVEGGSFVGNPMYVSMVIQPVSSGANPNVVTINDVLGGKYTITEVSDWSWRYACYDVEVQRSNDSQNPGQGTIIGVNPAPYKD